MADKWIIKPKHESKFDVSTGDDIFINEEACSVLESELLKAAVDWLSYGSEMDGGKTFTCSIKCFIRLSRINEDHPDTD
jgi:hypothetical protein